MVSSNIDLYDLISHRKVTELEKALKAGVNTDQLDKYGLTPIFRVVYNPSEHQVKMLKLLIQYGADVNFRQKSHGETVIHNATSVEVAEILLKNGADLMTTTTNGRTPLHKTTSAEVAQYFIDHGIDVNAKDQDGATPLFDAVYEGLKLVDCLLSNGAKADLSDSKGRTPLMSLAITEYADSHDNIELKQICDRLIASGAQIDSKDNKGKTAYQHANSVGNHELANYIKNLTH